LNSEEKDILEQIEDFFKIQRELYGESRLLNGKLIDNIDQIVESVTVPVAAPLKKQAQTPPGKGTLQEYNKQIMSCQKCALGKTRTNFVFGSGNPDADLMFVGEAPGRDEDLQGVPFVGRAGQLLTMMLKSIGLDREDVYIANVLKCRPPNNRDPQQEEIDKCEPYLLHQIELIAPKLIVTLGRFASASLLRRKDALGQLRQEMHDYNKLPLVVTYHPAALLRNPQLKRNAWEDLKKIKKFLL
jgi:uracil-DNA glycosylase family 4